MAMGRSIADARVTRAWRPSYDPALCVRQGDRVEPGREDDEYPGWVWCVDRAGLGGWLPVEILAGTEILFDFNCMELSVDPGMRVETLEARHGWVLARRSDGATGWLPLDTLAQ